MFHQHSIKTTHFTLSAKIIILQQQKNDMKQRHSVPILCTTWNICISFSECSKRSESNG